MAGKNMTFSFKIAGMLAGNFKPVFNEAANTVKKLQSTVTLHNKTLDESKLAYDKNIVSVKSYNNVVKQVSALQASKAAFDQNIISGNTILHFRRSVLLIP